LYSTPLKHYTNKDHSISSIFFLQGVFFRKHTQQEAVKLGIFGFVQNEADGTVTGEAEGRMENIVNFKYWLQVSLERVIEGYRHDSGWGSTLYRYRSGPATEALQQYGYYSIYH